MYQIACSLLFSPRLLIVTGSPRVYAGSLRLLRWLRDWSIPSVRRGWERWGCAARRRLRKNLTDGYNSWREGGKELQAGSLQCQGKRQQAQTETQRVPPEPKEKLFCWALAQVARELWSVCPWRCSKAAWTWSWSAGSEWLCLSGGVGQSDLQASLPTCDSWPIAKTWGMIFLLSYQ